MAESEIVFEEISTDGEQIQSSSDGHDPWDDSSPDELEGDVGVIGVRGLEPYRFQPQRDPAPAAEIEAANYQIRQVKDHSEGCLGQQSEKLLYYTCISCLKLLLMTFCIFSVCSSNEKSRFISLSLFVLLAACEVPL